MKLGDLITPKNRFTASIYDTKYGNNRIGKVSSGEVCLLLQKEFENDITYGQMIKILVSSETTGWVDANTMKPL